MYIRCTMMINFIQQNKELAKLIQKNRLFRFRDDFQIFDVLVKCLKLVDVFQYLDRLLLQFHSTLVPILIWVSTVVTKYNRSKMVKI